MMTRFAQKLVPIFVIFLAPIAVFSGEISVKDRVLHFDQLQAPLKSLNFKHDDELKPIPNDFRIIEASYLSNDIGERWAFVTFENRASGQRLLKNKAIVATFVDGAQKYARNLNETLKENERLTKAVFFGIHPFPIVSVQVK